MDCLEKYKDYYNILEPEFPEWLYEYINTKELLKQDKISVTCGKIYSKLFDLNDYSSLAHSIGVALIVWHFTKDKKQTLSGLFHDIATPAFKHTVDIMNGDHMNQESTEELTTSIIRDSEEIMTLLKRDEIKVEEVDNYHKYPIADNDTPKLSADRLEYSLSNGLITIHNRDIDIIKEIYNDIEIQKNEEGEIELGFKTKKIAREFVKMTTELSLSYRDNETRYSMQFIADILKKLKEKNLITIDDLYNMSDEDIIKIIENSEYAEVFNKWRNATKVNVSKEKPEVVYSVNQPAKIRWIDPLFNGERMSKACKLANKMIEKNLNFDMDNYIYLDFNY